MQAADIVDDDEPVADVSADADGFYELLKWLGSCPRKEWRWQEQCAITLAPPSTELRTAFFADFFADLPMLPARVYAARKNILLSRTQAISVASDVSADQNGKVAEGGAVSEALHQHWQQQADAEGVQRRSTRSSKNTSENMDSKQSRFKSNYNGDLCAYNSALPVTAGLELTDAEQNAVDERDTYHQRELRTFLRMCLTELIKDRRYTAFARPVDPESVLDYYDVVRHPMDLETMRTKVGDGLYPSMAHFLRDLEQIVFNAQEYVSCLLAICMLLSLCFVKIRCHCSPPNPQMHPSNVQLFFLTDITLVL